MMVIDTDVLIEIFDMKSKKGEEALERSLRAERVLTVEPKEDGILVRNVEDPDDLVLWIRERRGKVKGRMRRLGELADVDLEEEFEA